jgi:hypothetical protein
MTVYAALVSPGAPQKKQDWRIDLQLAGEKTVLLSRQWEHRPFATASYGLSFERAVTSDAPGCEDGAPGHIRVVSYVSLSTVVSGL